MGTLSPVHWLLVALVVLLVFGPKRLAAVGRDLGATLRSFKKGVSEERAPEAEPASAAPGAAKSSEASSKAASH